MHHHHDHHDESVWYTYCLLILLSLLCLLAVCCTGYHVTYVRGTYIDRNGRRQRFEGRVEEN